MRLRLSWYCSIINVFRMGILDFFNDFYLNFDYGLFLGKEYIGDEVRI